MYDLYIEHWKERHWTPVKSNYRDIFNKEFNLRFHRPYSDTCSRYNSFNKTYKNSQNAEKVKAAKVMQLVHDKKSWKALASKQIDENLHKESPDTLVICFKLQQALPTPLHSLHY